MVEPRGEPLGGARHLAHEPGVRLRHRLRRRQEEPLHFVGGNPTACGLAHQRVERLPEPDARVVQLQHGRRADRLLVEARHVDEEREVVEAAAVGLQREQRLEEAAAEADDRHRELAGDVPQRELINEVSVETVLVEPHDDALAQLASQLLFERGADGPAGGT